MSEHVEDAAKPEDEVRTVQRTSTKTKMAFLCLLAMMLLLIGIIVFLLYFTQSFHPNTKRQESNAVPEDFPNGTCKNPECLHTAAHILNSIDFTKEPCENFYNYACGKADVEDEGQLDIFEPKYFIGKDKPQFLKKFRRFYESCVTHEDKFDYETRVNNAKSLLNRVGSIRKSNKENDGFNLTTFVADMILHNSMPLFDVVVDVDPNNSTFMLKLMLPDQTSVSLGHWSSLSETKRKCLRKAEDGCYEKEVNITLLYKAFLLCQKNYGNYLDSITTSMLELQFFPNMTENEMIGRLRNTRVFIEFEILSKFDEIAEPPDLQETNIRRDFAYEKLGNLEKKFPMIQWEILFETLTNKSMTKETVIQLYNQEYFEDVFRGLSVEKNRHLNNAFLALLANNLYESTVLPTHRHTREQYCKHQSKELMPDIVNYLHKVIVEPKLVHKKNGAIKEMFGDLKNKFVKSLQQKWLDTESKSSIVEKLNDLKLVLFENGDVEDERKYLETAYESLDISENEYQLNHFDLMEFRRKQFFALHGENLSPENIYRTFVDVTSEEPTFFHPSNIVCLPFGLYKHIRDDIPQYLVNSRVGFALARIIGHAFDSIGIEYGVNLTETARNTYQGFADETRDMLPLINPMSFSGKLLFFNLNNDLSESDRIADNTAMKLMTDYFPSFQELNLLPLVPRNFTREKLFFLHLVQGLCRKMKVADFMVQAHESPSLTPQLRVANFLGNSKEFLRTFSCKPGSGMARIGESLQFPYLV